MKISSWWNLTPDPTDSSRGWFLSLDWGTLGSTLDRVLMIRAVWRFMLWLITEGGLVEAGEVEEIGGAVEVKIKAGGLEEHDLD